TAHATTGSRGRWSPAPCPRSCPCAPRPSPEAHAWRAPSGSPLWPAVRAEAPRTVGTVLDARAREHPPLERRVRDELGHLRAHVNLFVDSDNVRHLDGLATPIAPGPEL